LARAALGDEVAANPVAITVVEPNEAPVFGAIGPFEVAEGALLRFAVTATDPDGDVVAISAPGLALENAIFDEFSGELVFQPSHEQAGTYQVVFRADDGTATAQAV